MSRVLVLNADGTMLNSVTVKHAVRMLVRQVAEIVESTADRVFGIWNTPTVVRLVSFIYPKWRFSAPPKFSKAGVLLRDKEKCAYCGKKASTIDHVIPRAIGGKNSWDNCVAACLKCNNKKADLTVFQAGLVLRSKPRIPTYDELLKGKI